MNNYRIVTLMIFMTTRKEWLKSPFCTNYGKYINKSLKFIYIKFGEYKWNWDGI